MKSPLLFLTNRLTCFIVFCKAEKTFSKKGANLSLMLRYGHEGTSQYYFPHSDEIEADKNCIKIVADFLSEYNIPFICGKVWTSDAIYRETPNLIAKRKEQGCLGVEMECAASIAVARFRNIPFAQFLFGADNLDCEEYDMRDLILYGRNAGNKYLSLAFECGIRL